MVKEKPKFLLYKLEPTLEKLEKKNLEDEEKKEEYIKRLFSHQNLEKIFPDLFFLDNQVNIKNKEEKSFWADTLAFDKKRNTFVVIEYKRRESSDLFHQAKFYLIWLNKKEWIVRDNREKIEKILEKVSQERGEKLKEPEWDKSYALCITPEIGRYKDYFMETEERIRLRNRVLQ